MLPGKRVIVGCPKLDDSEAYKKKLTKIFENSEINSITLAHMEVPCCFGLNKIVTDALEASGENVPVEEITISVKGDKK